MPSKPRPARPLASGYTRVSFAVSESDWEKVGKTLTWGQRSLLLRRFISQAAKKSPNLVQAFLRGEVEVEFRGRQ